MSDNLRTRVAAVVDAYFDTARREQGYIVDGVTGDEVADAVIRELNDMGIIHLSRVVGCQTGPVGHEGECR